MCFHALLGGKSAVPDSRDRLRDGRIGPKQTARLGVSRVTRISAQIIGIEDEFVWLPAQTARSPFPDRDLTLEALLRHLELRVRRAHEIFMSGILYRNALMNVDISAIHFVFNQFSKGTIMSRSVQTDLGERSVHGAFLDAFLGRITIWAVCGIKQCRCIGVILHSVKWASKPVGSSNGRLFPILIPCLVQNYLTVYPILGSLEGTYLLANFLRYAAGCTWN